MDKGDRIEQIEILSENDKFLISKIAQIAKTSNAEWDAVMRHLFSRLDELESKLDKIIQNQSQREQQIHINFEGYELAKKIEQCQKIESKLE